MFTQGQITFAILFAIAFIAITIWSYRKDIKIHKKQYKGSLWILIGFIVFLVFLLLVKNFMKS